MRRSRVHPKQEGRLSEELRQGLEHEAREAASQGPFTGRGKLLEFVWTGSGTEERPHNLGHVPEGYVFTFNSAATLPIFDSSDRYSLSLSQATGAAMTVKVWVY